LLSENYIPLYHIILLEHLLSSFFIPAIINSLILGIDNRKSVSCIARQSSSATNTALTLLPVMIIGSLVSFVLSISR